MHPKLSSLQAFWESKRKDGALPGRSDFDVLELWPWLGHLALVEVIDGGADFRYRLHGTTMVEILGMDLTGRRLSEMTDVIRAVAGPEFRAAVATGRPTGFTRIRVNRSVDHRQVTTLILPLATDGRTIDMLLYGVYFAEGNPARR